MKKFLLSLIFMCGHFVYAQDSSQCSGAYPLCGSLGVPFANVISGTPANPVNDYGCLATQPNPVWFILPVSQSGSFVFDLEQYTLGGTPIDVDFICYGPFEDANAACDLLLTEENTVDCSYSGSAFETVNIDNAVAGEYYILLITNFSAQAGNITINNTPQSTGVLNCAGINLTAFLDSNANGIQDNGEGPFPLGDFVYQGDTEAAPHSVTSYNGNYTIYGVSNSTTYDIQYTLPAEYAAYYTVAPSSYDDVPLGAENSIATYTFAVTPVGDYQDVAVYVIPTGNPMPGFTYTETLIYTNLGNQIVPSGTVSFTNDALVTITDISETAAVTTTTGFDVAYTNLAPFETRTIVVTMEVPVIPTVNLGDLLTSSATITPLTDDVTPSNNSSQTVQTIIGSYDPNDKVESHGRDIIIDDFTEDDYLYYTIRFQNSGTASAVNVRIEDLLDGQLDANTVEVLHASHDFTFSNTNNNLVWIFNNIMLPAEMNDEPGSHGFVYFKVKPAIVTVETVIPNTASIYFDFNPAIVTNTFETHFMAPLSVNTVNAANFVVYPNPTKDIINVAAGSKADIITAVRIYDITGKTLYTNNNITTNSLQIDGSTFASGTYFIEVTGNNNSKTVQKLLKQ
ncbi:T9SS type A sorting domain-containing protein [Flavobacterium zepuense]|uniref:T9SS type A sorting domain-containing protein n=1 Tax=Flavobacterium zepuense TaxID=2593302 RepID=A0A552V2I2_9FLAO|nr:T9SS type A sorting domain-containing protein [Flavobacterium zepuense]TRW24674.1 T9SS type A sorting domain-containing protein [Flavobacterium zepuense]